jgi:hypothetical protein
VIDPQKGPIVLEMFTRYATGKYSDIQIAEWLNEQGLLTNRSHPFGKDTVRDMLCNPYYAGKIRYRGMSVRPKGVSYRSTPPNISQGKHEPIISEELWQRCQEVRLSRRVHVKTKQKTVRVNLLQGLAVCARCERKLRIQTPKKGPTYYREDSHLRGYRDCMDISQSVRASVIDEQVAELVKSLKLSSDWDESVRRLTKRQEDAPDPETERKEIRTTIRLMRENYERGLYEGEEYIYWQKVNALKEKLDLLNRIPESAIERAASTLLDLRQSWEWATKEERRDLVRMMIQEVGVDVTANQVVWVKARPDFDVLFQFLNNLRIDDRRRFWIAYAVADQDTSDIGEDMGQMGTGVKIALPMSHNSLTITAEYVK